MVQKFVTNEKKHKKTILRSDVKSINTEVLDDKTEHEMANAFQDSFSRNFQ